MEQRPNAFLRFFASVLRGLDLAARLIVNLAVLALFAILVVWLWPDGGPEVPERTALVVDPVGYLVEEESGLPGDRALQELLGSPPTPESALRPILEAIERGRDDERVAVLVLDLDRFFGGGLSKLQAIGGALRDFRDAGKPVVAVGDYYFQAQYYLAAMADRAYVHPMGMVLLQGYGSYRRYYREAIDRIEADWNVFRVGEYKTAVEPYLRDGMSPEAREARLDWLGDLWQGYRADVAAARELEPAALEDYVGGYHLRLREHRGDAAAAALAAGLVDGVLSRDEMRDELIELAGEDEEGSSYSRIGYRSYLAATEGERRRGEKAVAVVVASGTILDGRHPPGTVGGDSTAELIREAREDEDVAALVLRVDSPGGSTFAAEIIRRELELTSRAGKPVVASMGSVAASGGYWISMAADRILASPTTITGSIGIYAMVPTFERSLEKLGIHNDGAGTHPLAGTLRFDRSLPDEAAEALQLMVEQGYRDFLERAAEAREMTVGEVDRIARGRVWSGTDALHLGLIDELGDLEAALDLAAELAELGDTYRIRWFRQQPSWSQQLLAWLVRTSGLGLGPAAPAAGLAAHPVLGAVLDSRAGDLALLQRPGAAPAPLAYCFCDYE